MPVNDFLPFCETDTGSNLLTQSQYAVDVGRDVGNVPGTARSRLVNKAIRQSSAVTAALAQATSDRLNQDVLDDGNQAALVAQVNALFASLLPSGTVFPFAGSTAPTYFLLCYGQTVSRSTYAALFAAIGITYGAGDGSTTFGLPDLRGRAVAGRDDMGGSAANRITALTVIPNGNTLGAVGGAQTHTLTTAQIPSHNHTQNAHNHTQDPHTHTMSFYNNNGGGGANPYGSSSTNLFGVVIPATTATNQATTATNNAEGGGGAHNNTQPTIVMNYIIKI